MTLEKILTKMLKEIDSADTHTESVAKGLDDLLAYGEAYGQSGYETTYDQKTALFQASDALLEAERELRRTTRLVKEARELEKRL